MAAFYSYTMAHIWACPPSEGDDYIFHCHPPEQKIPKPKRLQDWYKKMLDKAIIERVVIDYKVIFPSRETWFIFMASLKGRKNRLFAPDDWLLR